MYLYALKLPFRASPEIHQIVPGVRPGHPSVGMHTVRHIRPSPSKGSIPYLVKIFGQFQDFGT
jgi:hypothetical protein